MTCFNSKEKKEHQRFKTGREGESSGAQPENEKLSGRKKGACSQRMKWNSRRGGRERGKKKSLGLSQMGWELRAKGRMENSSNSQKRKVNIRGKGTPTTLTRGQGGKSKGGEQKNSVVRTEQGRLCQEKGWDTRNNKPSMGGANFR